MSRQDEMDLVLWLAVPKWALEITCCVPEENLFSIIINLLLTKLVSSRRLVISLVLFCMLMDFNWTPSLSIHKHTKQQTWPIFSQLGLTVLNTFLQMYINKQTKNGLTFTKGHPLGPFYLPVWYSCCQSVLFSLFQEVKKLLPGKNNKKRKIHTCISTILTCVMKLK